MKRIRNLLVRLLPQGKFARGVAVLAAGTVTGQIIVVLAAPVLTRLYSPEEFGTLAVYAATLQIITVVASLRYEIAIPLPRNDGSAANVLALSFVLVVIVGLLIALLVPVFGPRLAAWTGTPELIPYLWLVPLGVVLGGGYVAFSYWAVRRKSFERLARTRLQQGVGMVVTQIALGLVQFGALGLLLGHIVGQAAGLANLVRKTLTEDVAALRKIRTSRAILMSKRYDVFPKYSTWAGLSNVAGSQLPMILFAGFFSPVVAGLYMLTDRILNAPIDILGRAVGKVFHGHAAERRREGGLGEFTLGAFEGLLRIGAGPTLILTVFAPDLFEVLFGTRWRDAGVYAQLLAPMILVRLVFSPLSVLGSVVERVPTVLVFQVILLGGRVLAIGAGVAKGSALLAVLCFSSVSALIYVCWMSWVFRVAGLPPAKWMRVAIREIGLAAFFAFLFWYSTSWLFEDEVLPQVAGEVALITLVTVAAVLFLMFRGLPYWKRNLA